MPPAYAAEGPPFEPVRGQGVRQIFGPGTRIPAAALTIINDLSEDLAK